MHFGENQLSPGSIGISPLSTAHPPVLQHWWVRASTRLYPRFTLAMDSSLPVSGLIHATTRALHTRFRFGSGYYHLSLAAHINSPVRSTKSTPSGNKPSDSLWAHGFRFYFTPLIGVLFNFPSRYSFTIGQLEYLALDGGPPCFPRSSHVRRGTPDLWLQKVCRLSRTRLSLSAVRLSRHLPLDSHFVTPALGHADPKRPHSTTPITATAACLALLWVWAPPLSFATTRGMLSSPQGT